VVLIALCAQALVPTSLMDDDLYPLVALKIFYVKLYCGCRNLDDGIVYHMSIQMGRS